MLLTDRLLSHWKLHGVEPRPPCTLAELQAFEGREGVVLPDDMRSYWLSADGMPEAMGKSQDREGFSFWPLHRVARADIELRRVSPKLAATSENTEYYVFADYLDWSWAYAIKLRSSDVGKVVIVDGVSTSSVADSFAEFIEAYLVDEVVLYPGRDNPPPG